MSFETAFEALGGRKFFGFVVTASLLSVVSVYAKLDPELAYSLVALYVAFVGGNAFNTLQAMRNQKPSGDEAAPEADLTPVYNAIAEVQQQVNVLTQSQTEFTNNVTKNMEILGKKIAAVVTLKG